MLDFSPTFQMTPKQLKEALKAHDPSDICYGCQNALASTWWLNRHICWDCREDSIREQEAKWGLAQRESR